MIVASIDIGTNAVLSAIVEIFPPGLKIRTVKEFQDFPRLGEGLKPGGKITENKIAQLLEILQIMRSNISFYGCEKVYVTCTNAFRISLNGSALADIISDEFGWDVSIVSGETEAELTFLGVSGFNSESSLIVDIGGGSTELVTGSGGVTTYKRSFQAGVVSAVELINLNGGFLDRDITRFKQFLNEIFDELAPLELSFNNAYAVAGTPITLACIKKSVMDFREAEGEQLSVDFVREMMNIFSNMNAGQIASVYPQTSKGRADIIFAGTAILLIIMEKLGIDFIKVSSRGLRYGAVLKDIIRNNNKRDHGSPGGGL